MEKPEFVHQGALSIFLERGGKLMVRGKKLQSFINKKWAGKVGADCKK